jgi:urocanate hydratase
MVRAREEKRATSIAYHGNVVDLWERLAADGHMVDLGSDQTSCHDPFGGGYYPQQLTVAEANVMMTSDPDTYGDTPQFHNNTILPS